MAEIEKTKGKIYLFDPLCKSEYQVSQLKHILSFLKAKTKTKLPNFSYIGAHTTPMKSLTMQENLLLECLPQQIHKNKDSLLKTFLIKNRNLYFQELFTQVSFWNKLPGKLSEEELSFYALISALIKRPQFMILERPEEIFCPSIAPKIQKALEFEVHKGNSNVIIYAASSNPNWTKLCDVIVEYQSNHLFKEKNFANVNEAADPLVVRTTKKKTA